MKRLVKKFVLGGLFAGLVAFMLHTGAHIGSSFIEVFLVIAGITGIALWQNAIEHENRKKMLRNISNGKSAGRYR